MVKLMSDNSYINGTSTRSDADVLESLSFYLAELYARDIKLFGNIYLHRITDVRYGGVASRQLNIFRHLCGENDLDSVVLATTFWQNLARCEGRPVSLIQQELVYERKNFTERSADVEILGGQQQLRAGYERWPTLGGTARALLTGDTFAESDYGGSDRSGLYDHVNEEDIVDLFSRADRRASDDGRSMIVSGGAYLLIDDVRSVVSLDDDINPQFAPQRNMYQVTAKEHLATMLAQNQLLKPLYRRALSKIEKDRFVRSVQRLLKAFYLDLISQIENELQRAATNLLKSNPGLAPPTDPLATEDDVSISTDDDDDDSEADADYDSLLPRLTEVENFMFTGDSLRLLVKRVRMFLIPVSISGLMRILMTIPFDRIQFLQENHESFLNTAKASIYSHTEENWD
ncbi:hypothetical protein ACLMJK_005596 [Lecanora helva]